MTLKKYTLIGLIGFLILSISLLYWVVLPIYNIISYDIYSRVPSSEISESVLNILSLIIRLIGYVFIMMFFYKLYEKQKE